MKLAILGSRGIPNNYGGFEQFAEKLALGLSEKGHDVSVYNPHNHPYKKNTWKNINIIHKYDPEYKFGTFGQFIYDLNCILDSRKKQFDIILQLGYTSNSIWGWLLPREKTVIATNMDGLEWKRSKFSAPVKKYLKFAEKLAIKYSHYYIADSIGIQTYLSQTYHIQSTYIPYGAEVVNSYDNTILNKYALTPGNYDMLIARLEPENNIETILQGFCYASVQRKFVVIGNFNTKYGNYLKSKFANNHQIFFLGAIYDQTIINNLRYFSNLYFHGHSVGGTNPSLLEAMASSCLICAHNNVFNQSILANNAYYFRSTEDAKEIIQSISKKNSKEQIKLEKNLKNITSTYSWNKITDQYEKFLFDILPK